MISSLSICSYKSFNPLVNMSDSLDITSLDICSPIASTSALGGDNSEDVGESCVLLLDFDPDGEFRPEDDVPGMI